MRVLLAWLTSSSSLVEAKGARPKPRWPDANACKPGHNAQPKLQVPSAHEQNGKLAKRAVLPLGQPGIAEGVTV
jgi:hypothetical protein